MFAGLPSLTHEQQQKAVERIQELMAQGMSSGQAIALVQKSCVPTIPASESWRVLRMKTSNTLIRIAFVIEADDYLIVRKRTLFICD
ncbi:FIG01046632: hypothetical protein [Escherichia coli IS29]|nr:FIG01046632: hypothetical protein [Escherichia coli IS29]